MGYASRYESYLKIRIERGGVVGTRVETPPYQPPPHEPGLIGRLLGWMSSPH